MDDERLDQIPASLFERLSATEISGIGLNESGIEVVLADQEAEAISEPRLAIVRAIQCMRITLLPAIVNRLWRAGGPTEFLDRTKPDSVRLPQRAVDGA